MIRPVTLTCHTKDCVNAEIPIVLETDATNYGCGACGQFITDAVEVTEVAGEPTTEAK